MGFTRSTTTTNVHSTLGDYPAKDDGLTAAQLKSRFDSPATGLKTDLNGLMDELENVNAASKIGANEIYEGDTTDGDVQSKLEHIYSTIEDTVLGQIPDNSITQAKLNSTYEGTLAKKDGNLQSGLNAEKLGGSTLAQVLSTAASRTSASDTTITKATTDDYTTTHTVSSISCRFILFVGSNGSYKFSALYDCRNNKFLFVLKRTGSDSYVEIDTSSFQMSDTIKDTSYSSNTLTFKIQGNHAATSIKCIQLDGLLP